MSQDFHLSDEELLQSIDGELAPRAARRAHSHLSACWLCRERQREIETSIDDFVGLHKELFDGQLPPPEGPRALLKARLAQAGLDQPAPRLNWNPFMVQHLRWMTLFIVLGTTAVYLVSRATLRRSVTALASSGLPNPALTPGAVSPLNQPQVCRQVDAGNKGVSVALQRRVFDEYGIQTPEPGAYEIDYLITPALGGADDIQNLWPQSSRSAPWNSLVKDTLEDHLRDLVCDGQLELATAQRDLAGNWIEAYKKYFHTSYPLDDHPQTSRR